MAVKAFGDGGGQTEAGTSVSSAPVTAAPILIERKGDLEQAHLIIAAPWPSALSDDRYAASMLGTIVGGGTSTPLCQSVRDERGRPYYIGARGNTFTDVLMSR